MGGWEGRGGGEGHAQQLLVKIVVKTWLEKKWTVDTIPSEALDRQFVDCSTELICFVHFDVCIWVS